MTRTRNDIPSDSTHDNVVWHSYWKAWGFTLYRDSIDLFISFLVSERVDVLEAKINNLDTKFDEKIDGLDAKINDLYGKFDDLNEKVNDIDWKIDDLRVDVTQMVVKFNRLLELEALRWSSWWVLYGIFSGDSDINTVTDDPGE